MLPLPKHFDENEWCIIILILLGLLLWKLPNRIPTSITVLILLLGISIPKVLDQIIAAIAPYDLYRITDTNKYDLFDLLLDLVYMPFGYVCIYLYDFLRPRNIQIALYILCWTLFAVGFEFVLVKLHVFNYHGWKLVYSFSTYIVTITTFVSFYTILLYRYKKKNPPLQGDNRVN